MLLLDISKQLAAYRSGNSAGFDAETGTGALPKITNLRIFGPGTVPR